MVNKYFAVGYREFKKLTSRKTKDDTTNQNVYCFIFKYIFKIKFKIKLYLKVELEKDSKWVFSSFSTDGKSASILFVCRI